MQQLIMDVKAEPLMLVVVANKQTKSRKKRQELQACESFLGHNIF